jgi:pimeloyl-[acyl-carrier protein] methyl ester esterase
MHFVLVHGWGFHAGIWADFIAQLGTADVTLVDLGFVSGGPKGQDHWPSDSIAVGHSLGLLWLLERGGGRFKALVSVQGFDCFCCHVAPSRVDALQRGIERNPGETIQAFWRSCGASGFALPQALNAARLNEGLDWLRHWDGRNARQRLDCPILALAARDDPIVSSAMTEAIWQGVDTKWSLDGGHVLPLRHPKWCARHVVEFADTLPS